MVVLGGRVWASRSFCEGVKCEVNAWLRECRSTAEKKDEYLCGAFGGGIEVLLAVEISCSAAAGFEVRLGCHWVDCGELMVRKC